MKKIGILTLNGNFNYGNRLQNYALQEALRNLGFNVETILNTTNFPVKKNKFNNVKVQINSLKSNSLNELSSKLSYKIWKSINKNKINKLQNERLECFKRFTDEFIFETDYSISEGNIPEDLPDRYDYFVTGSDQVWNPYFRHGSSIDFLTFAPKNKRIAYAPSFGIEEIPLEYKDRYKMWLSEIDKLSVREAVGAKLIKELTGKEVPVVIDPTLLLTKEKWLSISKESDTKPKNKYLLTYFLGGIPFEHKEKIFKIAKDNNLDIVCLADIQDLKTYNTGPREFIDYINSASVFCTDSFHGAVFSILLEKPFIVFERIGSASMYSRIDTLLNKFELNSRKVENMSGGEDVFRIDFSHIPQILDVERKKSLDYLKNALEIKDAN